MFRQRLLNLITKNNSGLSKQFVRSYCSPESESSSFNPEKSLNEVKLLGRVGSEPQKRGTEENPVVTFQLATNTNYKDSSGEFNQKTEWHRVAIFRPRLRDSVYDYLRKGQRVFVTGRITYGTIKSESGSTVNTCSVIADDVIFFQT